jgi:carbon monoxide dehydrogenase subunit G
MTNYHPFEPVGLEVFSATDSQANFQITQQVDIQCTPEQLMEALSGDTIWTKWVAPLEKVNWESEKPFGQCARRTVHLKGGQVIREYFFHWVDNERIAFYVEEGTLKGVTIFAEDYRLSDAGAGQTRLTWTVALKLGGVGGLLAPLSRFFARRAMKGWLNKLKAIVESGAAE